MSENYPDYKGVHCKTSPTGTPQFSAAGFDRVKTTRVKTKQKLKAKKNQGESK